MKINTMKKSTLLIALLGFAKIMMAQNAAIEAFLSTPFITNLTISAKSDKIVWVENKQGIAILVDSYTKKYARKIL
jgi:hypothetical protein